MDVEDRVAETAARFADAVSEGALDLPLPGRGATMARWSALARLARADLCLARLAEAHTDALATMAELGAPAPPEGSRWGLWASRPPQGGVTAVPRDDGWVLDGAKPWCSGARACTHALVTAEAPDGYRLFAVDLSDGAVPGPRTWAAAGMAGSDTAEVGLPGVPGRPVGGPDDYLSRPGFWHGAIAVAACWYGGAAGLAAGLVRHFSARPPGAHALAHLGAIDAALATARHSFAAAAAEVDAGMDGKPAGEQRAARVRATVERVAGEVLERAGRAGGPTLFVNDPELAQLLVDLPVYLRQSHAEQDLERLGALALETGGCW